MRADGTSRAWLGRCLRWSLFASLLPAVLAFAAAPKDEDCLACHADPSLTKTVEGQIISLSINTNQFAKSVHGSVVCVDCHTSIKELPHPEGKLPPVQCNSCHEDIGKEYDASIHGQRKSSGVTQSASCADCHGSHYMVPVKHADSPVFRMNLPQTCARCHNNPRLTAERRMKFPHAASQYMESIHGRALLKMGLTAAPSCSDCHGAHHIRLGKDAASTIHRANIGKTCGKCHSGVNETLHQSVHGQQLAKGNPAAPVCSDCHTAHEIEEAGKGHFKSVSDERCGRCHKDRLTNYRETYHGKAMALGRPNVASAVAACYDCHGHHDLFPPSDARSRLSPKNITETCRHCHPAATAGFAGYLPHADPLNRQEYPQLFWPFAFMTSLLVGVFIVFGVHTGGWLTRYGLVFFKDPKAFQEARERVENPHQEWFTRFTPYERFLHFLIITSFLLLVVTGMPLKFYEAQWAKTLFGLLGGPETARSLHHFGAIVTFLYFGLHLLDVIATCWRRRQKLREPASGKFQIRRLWQAVFGPDSMMFSLQDLRDFTAQVKWFLGRGQRPQFDRWTYWERFDYFAVFWGVAIIGASGLILWFPEWFTRFLPGWIINVALIVHSDEALLAAGFIFTFHFFHTHFRLDKFPMDTVIFSGRISKAEMLGERRRWYDRLVAENRLDEYRVRDEWARWKRIAKTFGFAFFGLGVVLLLLIIYAMVARLVHGSL
jgi:cytochrome b subunit of formate dehydrogenase